MLMELQRHLEAMYVDLTLDPDPQSPQMVQSTRGQDGTCNKQPMWWMPTSPPSSSSTYVCVAAGGPFGLRQRMKDFVKEGGVL